jgi:hypothetical protein
MNWDAIGSIGEVLGSVGVMVTLVYFAVQIRGTQVATRLVAESTTQEARIAINHHRFENMELITKANRGDELSEVERSQARLIVHSENITMLMSFRRFRSLGEDGFDQARFFARFLCDNPGLEKFWFDEAERRRLDFGVRHPVVFAEWDACVHQHLLDIKSIRGTEV